MKKMFITLLLALVSLLASAHKVTLKVHGVDNSEGKIGVAVYTKDNFGQWNKATAAKLIQPTSGTTTLILEVPDGEYAFMVMHDENGNGTVDMDAQGVPIEPTGLSNDPVLHGFPTFEQLKTAVKSDKAIEIQLVRYK